MLICQTVEPSERGFTPKFEIVILISRSGESWFTVLAFKHFTEPLLLIIGEKNITITYTLAIICTNYLYYLGNEINIPCYKPLHKIFIQSEIGIVCLN